MSLSHRIGLRADRSRSRRALTLGACALLLGSGLVSSLPAQATHPVSTLSGSSFEIDDDANLKVDDAGNLDWANVNESRKQDTTSGPTDESFGQGTKEDTAVPTVVNGSIPPNKSDLKFFGVYQEGTTSTGFLNLFWSRVQEPSGTTNMDFEFNQSKTASANGVTPVRTAGDLLIQYDLSQGGVNAVISISRWLTSGSASACESSNSLPCWSAKTTLDPANAAGTINSTAIPAAESDGIGSQSVRTFGEAQLRLSTLFPNPTVCTSFGSAYLKSRSSDSFTAALKDFVPPVNVDIFNCGGVKVKKVDDAGTPLAGAEFTLYKDNAPIGGSRGAEDTITTLKCTTDATGICTITNVLAGEYWVVETVTPAGYDTAADQHVTVVAGVTNVEPLTFVDPRQRGAILVTKTRKHAADGPGSHPQSGVTFTVNGVSKVTDANGQACFDNLLFASYDVTETVPANYAADGATTKSVTVDNRASCTDSPYVGETVSFGNTPLSTITVSFTSQVAGGTAAQISCTGLTADPPDGTPSAFDDTSESFKNLLPGTYTCTVVVDP